MVPPSEDDDDGFATNFTILIGGVFNSLRYSLRHFMITQRIMSGLSFRQIADMCGTSVAQITQSLD